MLTLNELSSGWTIDNQTQLRKEFVFKSYLKTISFVNAIAWEANAQNHHPDLEVSFGKCVVKITTHDNGNTLSEKDFSLAKAIDRLQS
ncbi:MAG: 4a-hydroxytetrahydrobiopterin dehydratase [Bacteriovoracaceae bacterium]|nr:4a-hydroxytetrahydrobiopterin dehydratase [Bacteriovoracaceae bacterium]